MRFASQKQWPLAALLAGALWLPALGAQDAEAEAAKAEAQISGAADREAAREEIMQAYQKEYAFLVAQKRELQRRLDQFRNSAQQEGRALDGRIDALQDRLTGLESRAESLQSQINEAQRRRDAAQSNTDTLRATFQQAGVTFSDHGRDFMEDEGFSGQSQAEQLATVFSEGQAVLDQLSSVRSETGAFFTREGDKVEGTLLRVGDIAVYGVSESAAGVLAPAGGGELKIWEEAASDAVRAMAAGNPPALLPIFLYESLGSEVSGKREGSLVDKVNDGGAIGWLIVGLGAFAALLILARIIFLSRASASTSKVVDAVGDKLRERDVDGAIEMCRKLKGPTAAVVAAALRNMRREREQLEDIVNEAILHESSHLERFGSVILVIAAVSPLLGLLGTVTGMIATFDVITEFGTGDPELLSGGISIALVTTELGLIVAIPTLLVGNVLSGWAERIKDDMQKATLRVTNIYQEAAQGRAV